MDITPVGTGQMCDSMRLRLTYDRPAPAPSTVIAKLPAADPTSRATALALRSYETEVRFYQQLAPGLPMRTPEVFHSDIDVATASFVLLLEDLAPARQGDQLAGCSPEQAVIAVDELVKLHAPRWGDPQLDELEWLHRDPEAGQAFLLGMLPVFWAGFPRAVRRPARRRRAPGGRRALRQARDTYVPRDTEPWTVVHGDYRLDNLLFGGPDGGPPIAVVDWQTSAHGPGAVRCGVLHRCRPHYPRAARARARPRPPLLRRHRGGRGHRLRLGSVLARPSTRHVVGLIMAIAASMLVERTARGDEMFLAMAHRHARHALDLDAPALLDG